MFCKNCKGKNIKSRKNFTHGKSSKSKKTYTCIDCNSSEIQIEINTFNRKRRFNK